MLFKIHEYHQICKFHFKTLKAHEINWSIDWRVWLTEELSNGTLPLSQLQRLAKKPFSDQTKHSLPQLIIKFPGNWPDQQPIHTSDKTSLRSSSKKIQQNTQNNTICPFN